MEITSISFLVDEKRDVLKKKIEGSKLVDDFDIEDLDKVDGRKDVVITFKEPVNARFLPEILKKIFGEVKGKKPIVEE